MLDLTNAMPEVFRSCTWTDDGVRKGAVLHFITPVNSLEVLERLCFHSACQHQTSFILIGDFDLDEQLDSKPILHRYVY